MLRNLVRLSVLHRCANARASLPGSHVVTTGGDRFIPRTPKLRSGIAAPEERNTQRSEHRRNLQGSQGTLPVPCPGLKERPYATSTTSRTLVQLNRRCASYSSATCGRGYIIRPTRGVMLTTTRSHRCPGYKAVMATVRC